MMIKVYDNIAWGDESILKLLQPHECVIKTQGDKQLIFPRVRPLRKLIVRTVGPIVYETTSAQIIECDNTMCAACISQIEVFIENASFLGDHMVGKTITASAAADGTPQNCGHGKSSNKFSAFVTAMADTRAKGRSYVNILGLDVNVAEEIEDIKSVENLEKIDYDSNDKPATNAHLITISRNLERLQSTKDVTLDPDKVAKYLGFNYNKLLETQVSQINTKIRKWINGDNIPEDVLKS
jgi:hypothetical protein